MGYALITGATSGIGYEIACKLAERGYSLIITARNFERLSEIKLELEQKFLVDVRIFAVDLTKIDAVTSLYNFACDNNLDVDILINNAGFGLLGAFNETDWEKESNMINLNITALTHLTKLFVPKFIAKSKGKILNVASTASYCPGPYMSVYFATKAYVLSLSHALAAELKDYGITVTALCPGPTYTNFARTANAVDSNLFKLRKVATSEEVAEYGLKLLFNGRRVGIHGFINRMGVIFGKFFPLHISANLVKKILEYKR